MAKGNDKARPVRDAVRCRLDTTGLAVGLVFWWASLRPTLLPRTWLVQGVLSALSVLVGYGLGVLAAVVVKRIATAVHRPPPAADVIRWTRRVVLVLWLISIAAGSIVWLGWQNSQRDLIGMAQLSAVSAGSMELVALVVGAVLLAVARLVGYAIRWLDRTLTRLFNDYLPAALTIPHDPDLQRRRIDVPRILAAVATTVIVVVGGALFTDDFLGDEIVEQVNRRFGAFDTTTPPGVTEPTSPLVSGSPESGVSWDSLGYEGRNFVSGATTVAELEAFSGSATGVIEPIRVYAGLRSADTNQSRADAVVAELVRTGAADRAVLCVVTVTGTGWVDPTAAAGLEYLWDGNTAIAGMQYSYLPSWISFLVDSEKASAAGRALNDTVYHWWATLPEADRPRLVVFGESLGSFGSEAAFEESNAQRSVDAAAGRSDAVLWVGPTNANPVWGQVVDTRDTGTPVWQPIFRRAWEPVRFMTNAGNLRPSGQWGGERVLYVQHATDPVTWWNMEALWKPPPWLDSPRGPGVPSEAGWFPVVTWMQEVADLMAGFSAPPGYGHNYDPDFADAWATVLPPSGWTAEDTERLAAVLHSVHQKHRRDDRDVTRPPAAEAQRRTRWALVASIGLLVVYNPPRAFLLPSEAQVPANLAVAGVLLALAWWARCSASELGLARRDLASGARIGALAAAAIAALVVVGAVAASGTDALNDQRADVGVAGLIGQITISIALGTVVLEELAFRGSLLALLRREVDDRWAVVVSSLLFGAWHLAGVVDSSGDNRATAGVGLALVLVGTFVATSLAGVGLCWLRLRTRSLLAPALAHFSLNATAFLVAWIAAR